MSEANDTRDRIIATQAQVNWLAVKLDNFVDETREHRGHLDIKLNRFEALVNQGKGLWIGSMGLAALAGWLGSQFSGWHLFK